MTPSTGGGLLLILGAFALWRGSLIWSTAIYFFADIMWVIIAYENNNIFGTITVSIGMFLGMLVWVKSHRGVFVKTLHTKTLE